MGIYSISSYARNFIARCMLCLALGASDALAGAFSDNSVADITNVVVSVR